MKKIVVAAEESTTLVSEVEFGPPKFPARKDLSEETHHRLFEAAQAAVDEVAEERVSSVIIYTTSEKED